MPTTQPILGLPGAFWLALLLAVAAAAFTWRMVRLLRVLALGRWENRFNHIPLRIATFLKEVLGQSRMLAGDSIINWAHPLIFWGFCLFVVASALMFAGGIVAPWFHVPQVEEIPVLGTAVDLFAVLVLVGLVASSIRRYILRPRGLQRTWDATLVVGLIAGLMVTFLLAEAGRHVEEQQAAAVGEALPGWGQTWLPAGHGTARLMQGLGMSAERLATVGVAAWWIHVFILLFFLVYLPYSKHMHLLWAPFAVFFAELPHKGRLPDIPEMDHDPATSLGYFTWRMLLNGYTCAECGRCERACPVNELGSQLSPREILHDLKEFVLHEGMRQLRGHPGSNGSVPKCPDLAGDTIPPAVLWACTSCYACVDRCPVRNEHVSLIVQMRRRLLEKGELDDAGLQTALTSLQRYGNSLGKSARKRFAWATGLDEPLKDASKEPVDALWFLGDYAAYHPSSSRVSKMLAQVFRAGGLDFGVLPKGEQSAGNDVRRVGEEGLFEMLAQKNMKALGNAWFIRILTTDPHTYHVLKNEYGRFGLDKPVLHYTEWLDEALHSGQLQFTRRLAGTAVFHDPCYLGRYNGIYDPPRRVIQASGLTLAEMPRNRENSFCCGAGGGKIWMEEEQGITERPAVHRIREALDVPGVTHFVVACPKDLGMFEDAVKTVGAEDRLQVVDLGELVFQAIGGGVDAEADS